MSVFGDYDEMAVLTEWKPQFLVELNYTLFKKITVGRASEIEFRILTAIDEYLHAVNVHPVGALHAHM